MQSKEGQARAVLNTIAAVAVWIINSKDTIPGTNK